MALGFALFVVGFWKLAKIGRRPKGYPPGPPTLPLIGNLHQIPKSLGHLQFEKWAREYGPVYSLILGTKVVIVLSSDVAVKDLLDKRSAIYSSRPEVYLGQEVVSGNLRPLFMVGTSRATPYSDFSTNFVQIGVWRSLAYGAQGRSWGSECESSS